MAHQDEIRRRVTAEIVTAWVLPWDWAWCRWPRQVAPFCSTFLPVEEAEKITGNAL
jgi:hypothetical protein